MYTSWSLFGKKKVLRPDGKIRLQKIYTKVCLDDEAGWDLYRTMYNGKWIYVDYIGEHREKAKGWDEIGINVYDLYGER